MRTYQHIKKDRLLTDAVKLFLSEMMANHQ